MAGDPETLRVCRLTDDAGRPVESEVARAMAACLASYVQLYGRRGAADRLLDLVQELLYPTEDPRAIH